MSAGRITVSKHKVIALPRVLATHFNVRGVSRRYFPTLFRWNSNKTISFTLVIVAATRVNYATVCDSVIKGTVELREWGRW